jgi:UDP-2,4-diacetamido-2,4,6-trideoxy-beta-L-altropyranose hydrolase
MEKHLIIRVDASTQMGTGHLMRCLALAQAWKDASGKVTFVTACQTEGLLERLQEEGFGLNVLAHPYPDPGDWDFTKDILAAHPDAWVVLDGYHFNEGYQQWVKEAGHRLLVIDDMAHLKHYYADIVLNQNLHAEQLHYACEPYTRLLLGTHYVLLRREFLAWKNWKREIPKVARRVLVTLGGGDPENHTLKVIQTLQKIDIPGLEAVVVVGVSNSYVNVLESAVRQSHVPIRLICNAGNMPELMSWADVVVSGAGSTTWELVYMGVPMLAMVLAPNQEAIARVLKESNIAVGLNFKSTYHSKPINQLIEELLVNEKARITMSQMGKTLVDGQGAKRIVSIILDQLGESTNVGQRGIYSRYPYILE